jgi:hypothetical protein
VKENGGLAARRSVVVKRSPCQGMRMLKVTPGSAPSPHQRALAGLATVATATRARAAAIAIRFVMLAS